MIDPTFSPRLTSLSSTFCDGRCDGNIIRGGNTRLLRKRSRVRFPHSAFVCMKMSVCIRSGCLTSLSSSLQHHACTSNRIRIANILVVLMMSTAHFLGELQAWQELSSSLPNTVYTRWWSIGSLVLFYVTQNMKERVEILLFDPIPAHYNFPYH
jgi:hypothetical protein